MRLLLLTPAEISRDVRARRAAVAAQARGYDVVAACGRISGEAPVPFAGVRVGRAGRAGRAHRLWGVTPTAPRSRLVRDVRGVLRLARLLARTVALVRAARTVGPATVVHANDLDTLPAGVKLARQWGARLVYDAHELYSEFEAPAPPLTKRLTLALERRLARRADAIVTVSDGIADELVHRLGLAARPLVVVNAPHREERELRRFDEGGPLRAVYQGRLGPGRPLDDLLAAAKDADAVQLSLRIPLVDPAVLRESVAAQGLNGRVKILEPVPPERVLDALAEFEVGLLFDRPQSRNSELSFPNKLFEYLMAGLAVVAPRLESLGPLLEDERVGLTFEPGRPDALADALRRLAADRDLLLELRSRARELALTRLNAEAAAETLVAAWEPTRAG